MAIIYTMSVFLPFLAFFLQSFQLSHSTESLYNETDPVVILNAQNFKKTIYNAKNAWMVEFYSSWCGHCMRFAPTWKALAEDVKDWHDVIKLAVIDCSKDDNFDLCRDFDIHAFPTIKFFNASTSSGTGIKYTAARDSEAEDDSFFESRQIPQIREGIVHYLEKHTPKPPHWPDFTIPSLEWILNLFPSKSHPNVNYLVLIFEDKDSYVGREVILDMSSVKDILVRRVTKEDQNEAVLAKFGVDVFPSVHVMHRNGTHHRMVIDGQATRESFHQTILNHGAASDPRVVAMAFKVRLDGDMGGGKENQAYKPGDGVNAMQNILQGKVPKQQIQNEDGERKYITRKLPVYMQDLESTLHYSLRHEIPLHKVITGDTLTALKKFIAVLSKFFPGRLQVASYLEELQDWLEDNGDDEIISEDWTDFVNEKYNPEKAQDIYLPTRFKWVGCQGSNDIYRGYPCGLWTLFHTLTVSAATTSKNYKTEEKLEVLPAMRAYIAQFFGCRECATNFESMAVNIDSTVKTADGAVLWLWSAHNKANKRLHGDKTEDPEHPKIQFPPTVLCPSCQESTDGEWDEEKVLAFLKEYYHVNNIALDQLSRVMDSEVKKEEPQPIPKYRSEQEIEIEVLKNKSFGFFGLGLNGMDMSMCVLLYGFCIALVFLLYVIFCKRRRRKNMKIIV